MIISEEEYRENGIGKYCMRKQAWKKDGKLEKMKRNINVNT